MIALWVGVWPERQSIRQSGWWDSTISHLSQDVAFCSWRVRKGKSTPARKQKTKRLNWMNVLGPVVSTNSSSQIFFLRKPPNTIWGNDSISTKTCASRAWGRPTALQVRMKRSTSARQQNVWQSLHTTNTGSDIIVISQVIQIIHGTWVSMENLCKREHCFLTNQTLNSSCLLAL